jgi:uncharacterized Ntn-hydrolase superfamily protein
MVLSEALRPGGSAFQDTPHSDLTLPMPYSRGLLPRFHENVALVMPQAFSSFPLPFIICDLLEKGASFDEVHEAMKKDSLYKVSQVGIVKVSGDMLAYTGVDCRRQRCISLGGDYLVMGNILASEKTFKEMAAVMETTRDLPLQERLMRALEAGRDTGGQVDPYHGHLPELWTMLQVFDGSEKPLVDMRIDYDLKLSQGYAASWMTLRQ